MISIIDTRESKRFIVFELGGSCCNRYISNDTKGIYVKEIQKDVAGIENGFRKFYYEIEHMKKNNQANSSLYPKIIYVNEDDKIYSVGMEYCFNGVTLADLLRNETVRSNYFENSLEHVLDHLFSTLYIARDRVPNPNYIRDNYLQRITRRMKDISNLNIMDNYGFSDRLLRIEEKGFYLNGEYYPPISEYIKYIERDNDLLERLQITYTTDSHHDLIPANILVSINESNHSSIEEFKLIDPRGEDETGADNRHFIYDLGKMLLGIDTLDIFRIFNGKLSKKLYSLDHGGMRCGIDGYTLGFDLSDLILRKYQKAADYFWNLMEKRKFYTENKQLFEKEIKLKCLFSQACMYHPDISCRIIFEKDEEMAICMYLRGSMVMRRFMDYAYGLDPLRSVDNREPVDMWPKI